MKSLKTREKRAVKLCTLFMNGCFNFSFRLCQLLSENKETYTFWNEGSFHGTLVGMEIFLNERVEAFEPFYTARDAYVRNFLREFLGTKSGSFFSSFCIRNSAEFSILQAYFGGGNREMDETELIEKYKGFMDEAERQVQIEFLKGKDYRYLKDLINSVNLKKTIWIVF